jgi:prepilin-type N-terminal cleavage/methylation domain-containing protein
MMKRSSISASLSPGFTLVEMAIVLVIVGLILGGIMMPLSVQMEQRNVLNTRTTIANVQEALIGYAMANGRFPCPAAPGATGVESPTNAAITGVCTNPLNGFVPGTTLGITPTNANGYVIDGWNNPIRYAIAPVTDDVGATYVFTKSNGMKNAYVLGCPANCGMSWIAGRDWSNTGVPVPILVINQVLLSICNTSTGIANGTCSGAPTTITTSAALVVYSLGKNFATGGTGADEAANLDADTAFIDHTPTPTGAANGEYDDVMSWVSINTVFSRMVQAGQLP